MHGAVPPPCRRLLSERRAVLAQGGLWRQKGDGVSGWQDASSAWQEGREAAAGYRLGSHQRTTYGGHHRVFSHLFQETRPEPARRWQALPGPLNLMMATTPPVGGADARAEDHQAQNQGQTGVCRKAHLPRQAATSHRALTKKQATLAAADPVTPPHLPTARWIHRARGRGVIVAPANSEPVP
jgi:hypothetical protein